MAAAYIARNLQRVVGRNHQPFLYFLPITLWQPFLLVEATAINVSTWQLLISYSRTSLGIFLKRATGIFGAAVGGAMGG